MNPTSKKLSVISLCLLSGLFTYGQINWTKYPDNPVITKGPATWDIIAIGQPTVLFENDTIKMWYVGVGNDYKARICYATSFDGIEWTKHSEPVIDVGNEGDWDSGWLDTPEIVKDNEGYCLYFYGDTAQQSPEISSAIGVAYSTDGIKWEKEETNPIFTMGSEGEWDASWVESPAAYYDNGTDEYIMWYNGVNTDTWKVLIGLAISSNGISWDRYPDNPLLNNGIPGSYDDMWLGTPAVIFEDGKFQMWYSATSSTNYNVVTSSFDIIEICYASSANGIDWEKHEDNPLFSTTTEPYNESLDSGGPWAPDVIFNSNTQKYMMWFETEGGFLLATAPKEPTSINNNNSDINTEIFPNPFSETTSIKFMLKKESHIQIDLLDITGKQIMKLTDTFYPHGEHSVIWDGTDSNGQKLSAGLYICRLRTGTFQNTIEISYLP
ncbi:MAG: T9SS type A sorting domain-containing protein [Bacteroidales bacterium]|nr:T9SS type A sorting domain-containing protein [Bacteroidales bacterium]